MYLQEIFLPIICDQSPDSKGYWNDNTAQKPYSKFELLKIPR
jgi:hypothetical protein